MKIIIVGNGKVGYAIARQLSGENHDIVMVDSDAAALSQACWPRPGRGRRIWSSR